jgi:type II secretory pathway pseudopilin PulG
VARVRDESGFGMLELLIAMVVLNVALLSLVGVFNASTVAVSRSHTVNGAVAVADAQLEQYRALQNCAIWLDSALMPASGSRYALDLTSYDGDTASNPQIPYWSTGQAANTQSWVTEGTDGVAFDDQTNLASCAYTTGGAQLTPPMGTIDTGTLLTPPVSAVTPEQQVAGPDGTQYTVDTYIVLVKPTSGEWTKQVTVVVRDPNDVTRILARESAVFDPAPGT